MNNILNNFSYIMKKLLSSLILPVFIIDQLFVTIINCEICPENADTVTKILKGTTNTNHRKSCPDFKDDADQSYCCPSSITPGTFYCCTEAKKDEIDAEIAAEARRLFFRNNLSLIIIGSIITFVVTIIIVSFLCKRIKLCPLYQGKSVTSTTPTMSRYRPVDTIPPKPPAVYEAPPPYDYTVSRTIYDDQRREHDWNCLIENELNDNRAI